MSTSTAHYKVQFFFVDNASILMLWMTKWTVSFYLTLMKEREKKVPFDRYLAL